jgi:hypothetical protein
MNSEWQSIDTAPKDGRPILVAVAGDRYYPRSCWWSQYFDCWVVRENVGDGAATRITWPLTHWMPLPEPPR